MSPPQSSSSATKIKTMEDDDDDSLELGGSWAHSPDKGIQSSKLHK